MGAVLDFPFDTFKWLAAPVLSEKSKVALLDYVALIGVRLFCSGVRQTHVERC